MERGKLDREFELKNKIYGIRNYIASNWPSIGERKILYKELEHLEGVLKEIQNEMDTEDKPEENKEA